MSEQCIRTWYVRLTSGTSFPFFQTTRRDHTADKMKQMLPKHGECAVLIPVVGSSPIDLIDVTEYHSGKPFVRVDEVMLQDIWFIDDLPPAQQLRLYDNIHASTSEEGSA